MSFEYDVRFEDPAWLERNREALRDAIKKLGSYCGEADGGFLLRPPGSKYPFEARVFLDDDWIELEVSNPSRPIYDDLLNLLRHIGAQTKMHLFDAGDEVDLDPEVVFRRGV